MKQRACGWYPYSCETSKLGFRGYYYSKNTPLYREPFTKYWEFEKASQYVAEKVQLADGTGPCDGAGWWGDGFDYETNSDFDPRLWGDDFPYPKAQALPHSEYLWYLHRLMRGEVQAAGKN